jgi:hypothetical protein
MIYALLLVLWVFLFAILNHEEPRLSTESSWHHVIFVIILATYCVWLPTYFIVLLVEWVYFLTTGIKV